MKGDIMNLDELKDSEHCYYHTDNGVLLKGDCMEIMREFPDGCVDLVLTDIPYGVVSRETNGLRKFDKGLADVPTFDLNEFLGHASRITKGSIYIWCGTEQISEIRGYLASNQFSTRVGVWEKTNPSPINGQHIWLSGIELCVYGKKAKSRI
jgi:site-specific DNA-methyltransferase (adenine-specific)